MLTVESIIIMLQVVAKRVNSMGQLEALIQWTPLNTLVS